MGKYLVKIVDMDTGDALVYETTNCIIYAFIDENNKGYMGHAFNVTKHAVLIFAALDAIESAHKVVALLPKNERRIFYKKARKAFLKRVFARFQRKRKTTAQEKEAKK